MTNTEYFYAINYPPVEADLCRLEMKCLFEEEPNEKYFFSKQDINPSRSPFIKQRIQVTHSGETFEQLLKQIEEDSLLYENFKVSYIRVEGNGLSYEERLQSVREVALLIHGECEMKNPDIILGVAKYGNRWIFGVFEENDLKWHEHDKKPYTYCNSLSLRVAKALVNIAVGENLDATMIDPCCGVGTVVIEASSLGIDVQGYEINRFIATNAKGNLAFFGMEDVITRGDMHDIQEHYDVAIIDIPYGLFTPVTEDEQRAIIETARRIADKLVIVTFEDMDKMVMDAGFDIVEQCEVAKGKFKRYVSVCQ